jgi:CRP-like cAMP-binding protein
MQSHAGMTSPNRLLAALPDDEYARLQAELSNRPMKARETLHHDGEEMRQILFPGRSVCSVVKETQTGATIEVAMVGSEGLIGLAAAFGELAGWGSAIVQIEGESAQALSLRVFEREMGRGGAFNTMISRYSNAFSRMMMVKVACHALHSAKARCCSWLLASQDRIGLDDFRLTHEILANVLGVRRPTISLVIADLVRGQIVSQRRGQLHIVDRGRLERSACECYRAIKVLTDRASLP